MIICRAQTNKNEPTNEQTIERTHTHTPTQTHSIDCISINADQFSYCHDVENGDNFDDAQRKRE